MQYQLYRAALIYEQYNMCAAQGPDLSKQLGRGLASEKSAPNMFNLCTLWWEETCQGNKLSFQGYYMYIYWKDIFWYYL